MTAAEKVEEILRLAHELSVFYRDTSPLYYEANKILHVGWRMRDAVDADLTARRPG